MSGLGSMPPADMRVSKPQIFFGQVAHARLRPTRHAFAYRVFFLRLPLSCLDRVGGTLFSVNRWNLFSLRFADYGARDGSPPEPWIRALLAREGLTVADGEIVLQTFPRTLGYVFNPVSFWLCHDRAGGLRAILCEVSNTFGEHHSYLLAHDDTRPIQPGERLKARKVFHVSPFCEVKGEYEFEFSNDSDTCRVAIDYLDADGKLLLTSIAGKSARFSVPNLARAFLFYPWMTFGVIARIHWQALKLWFKGVRYIAKPAPPQHEVSR